MGNQVPLLDQCRNDRLRDPNPNPQPPFCGRACGRPCGSALEHVDGVACDPAGTFFDDTIAHLSDLDRLAFKFAATANLSAFRWLFLYGARPEAFDANGTTLLHVASRTGSIQIVKDLVRRSVSPDAMDRSGWTPLHVASCMGRQDVSLYLLRSGADPRSENNRGQLAEDLCSSTRTKDAVIRYDLHSHRHRAPLPAAPTGSPDVDALHGVTKVLSSVHFEPFFVPRVPVLQDPRPHEGLAALGLELFNRSPGHGIAFLVAAGVVPDYPVNINRFLLKYGANSDQYGDFLGAEYSVSKTLCLEFLNSLPLLGTGLVAALRIAFSQTTVPRDWLHIDRLARGIAHFWWQQHVVDYEAAKLGRTRPAGGSPARRSNGPRLGGDAGAPGQAVAVAGSAAACEPEAQPWVEVSGFELYRSLGSVEGLHMLLFSTMMLGRWLDSGHHLTFNEWMHLNTGVDGGSDVPAQVQTGIFTAVAAGALVRSREVEAASLRRGKLKRCRAPDPAVEGWVWLSYRGRARASHDGTPAAWLAQSPRSIAAQGGVLSAGRASAATADFEEISASWVDAQLAKRKEADPTPQPDRAWARVQGVVLLFATDPDAVPYAFVPLPAARVISQDRHWGGVVLSGRESPPPAGDSSGAQEVTTCGWVELCLLLHDGRYQSLEAPQLELRVAGADFDCWAAALSAATASQAAFTESWAEPVHV